MTDHTKNTNGDGANGNGTNRGGSERSPQLRIIAQRGTQPPEIELIDRSDLTDDLADEDLGADTPAGVGAADRLADPDSDSGPGGPDGTVDAETVEVEESGLGGPVDGPEVPASAAWTALTTTDTAGRAPIVPAWLRSRADRVASLKAMGRNLRYWVLFHLLRSPKYLAKTAWYAPAGLVRIVSRLLAWASAEEGNWSLRQHAATTNDAYTWQALNRTRSRESRARFWLLGPATAVVVIGLAALAVADVVPMWGWYAAAAGMVVLAARAGRPADKPITDRVALGRRFTRLTAEMVRAALVSLGFPALKEPGAVEFVQPIHRDGPGWLARVNLPGALEAVKVIDRRGGLSAAFRLPIDQVWPSPGPEHAGQLDIWVGYQPVSKMRRPAWSLADPAAVTSVFEPHEFGTDERQRPVRTKLFERSFLVGGRPGSGKSYAARAVATIGLLDPTVELKVAEFKGTGDFLDLEPLCSTYVVGVDDAALQAGASIVQWGLAEAERRGKRILAAKKAGRAPKGKVTPELSKEPGSGLHPVLILLDEVHELFAAYPGAAKDCERAIKRTRALNIIWVLATQIPDKDSLPPNIVRCVSNRWCLAVGGQVENDMILGTGAYKRGITATVYRPEIDAGWGVMTGLAAPVSVNSQFPDEKTTAAIVARAVELRGGQVVGADGEPLAARDLLADLAEVSESNGQHWAPAAEALTERWPEAYPNLSADALSELARANQLRSVDVKIAGTTRKGYRLAAIRHTIAERAAAGPGADPTKAR
jgi:DNA segregation ATPase FtsK/SpoIIIE, S-DNA-T family